MATVHILKVEQPFFADLLLGKKTFEVRFNDRGFKLYDTLHLKEYLKQNDDYTGRSIRARVSYILKDFAGLKDGYIVMGLDRIDVVQMHFGKGYESH